MRKITADQFETVGEMIDDLLINFEGGAKPLAGKSLALKNSLDDIGVHAFVNCYEDENMNMVMNLSVENEWIINKSWIKLLYLQTDSNNLVYVYDNIRIW